MTYKYPDDCPTCAATTTPKRSTWRKPSQWKIEEWSDTQRIMLIGGCLLLLLIPFLVLDIATAWTSSHNGPGWAITTIFLAMLELGYSVVLIWTITKEALIPGIKSLWRRYRKS